MSKELSRNSSYAVISHHDYNQYIKSRLNKKIDRSLSTSYACYPIDLSAYHKDADLTAKNRIVLLNYLIFVFLYFFEYENLMKSADGSQVYPAEKAEPVLFNFFYVTNQFCC